MGVAGSCSGSGIMHSNMRVSNPSFASFIHTIANCTSAGAMGSDLPAVMVILLESKRTSNLRCRSVSAHCFPLSFSSLGCVGELQVESCSRSCIALEIKLKRSNTCLCDVLSCFYLLLQDVSGSCPVNDLKEYDLLCLRTRMLHSRMLVSSDSTLPS